MFVAAGEALALALDGATELAAGAGEVEEEVKAEVDEAAGAAAGWASWFCV